MTDLLYLSNTYLFEETATVVEIRNNDFWRYVILDKTIFYPQWWGQPSDTGTITSWDEVFHVRQCKLNSEWVVYHYWEWILQVWDNVDLNIDDTKRMSHARNHSAGHLIDVAMMRLWYDSSLKPTKGYHFSNGAYVEYEWAFNEDKEIFTEKMDQTLNELVAEDIPIHIKYEWLWELEAPTGKSPRYVYFEWYTGVWCGGTHVKKSWEIGWVSLRKVKYKKGVLRVSYEIKA